MGQQNDLTIRDKFRLTYQVLDAVAEHAEQNMEMADVYHLEMAHGIVARYMRQVEDHGTL